MSFFKKIRSWISSYWQILLGLLCFFFAVLFFAKSGNEIKEISSALEKANTFWIITGLLISIVYVLLQGLLYFFSFRTIQSYPAYFSMVLLYLKRFLISVILPAGGVTSLAFSTKETDAQNISSTVLIFGSSIYMFASCTSIFVFSIPAILITSLAEKDNPINPLIVIPVVIILALLVITFFSYKRQGRAYTFVNKHYPTLSRKLDEINLQKFSTKFLIYTFITSVFLDFTGISFAFSAMKALSGKGSLTMAFLSYVVVFFISMVSPFMNGLGAIEAALTYLFRQYGLSPAQALLTALIYRLFSFWTPLLYSIFSYILYKDSLFLKVFPAVVCFLLGMLNILTLLIPVDFIHFNAIRNLISNELFYTSTYVQFVTGAILIINSIYLWKGYRTAWYIALFGSFISTIAHLTKGGYYEFSIASFLIIAILLYTERNYTLQTNLSAIKRDFKFPLVLFVFIILYGTLGFYLMDTINFGSKFTIKEAFSLSLKNILLIGDSRVRKSGSFGNFFILSLRSASIVCFLYVIILSLLPLIGRRQHK
ncbi:MAG: flippase-like domain-containing protein [Sporocytophaga sp.]|uniref:lysylphosphatidylglycerol synthase domain-containing protein n=1 Tax=Sporocytophaga sp. TaxID=2231183 RepID=UPI001B1F877B|nr:lysylphosphatidylglycerol synthase domain-containing protein [Sporocytophaga sp.]MBO9702837.1 flippase-like domain-containing protein [Sporocytophaga sp.]